MTRGRELAPGALARRLTRAPRLADAAAARARVADWLATPTGAVPAALVDALPSARALIEGIADGSPYLWDLIERDGERLATLLQSDPDEHLAALLAATVRALAQTEGDDEAMRLLRRMKAEAALLIALADIGGAWEVMRVTRALTEVADTAVGAAADFLLAGAARGGRLSLRDPARPSA